LLTRHKSTEAAVDFLAAMLKKQPGALLLRSLQAGALASMNEHQRAVALWNEYLVDAPSSSFALGRLSRSLARLDKQDLALAAAKKALALSPTGREARLVLAARQLDAGKLDDARASLQPLVSGPKPPAEPLLHLGLAYLAAQDINAAKPLFEQAAERAHGPRAWRTKGRALYNLALIEVTAGHRDAAKALLMRSQETGFTAMPIDPSLADLTSAPTTSSNNTAGSLYVAVAPLDTELDPAVGQLGASVLHDRLSTFGASFAPVSEEKDTARALIKSKGLRAYELRVKLLPVSDAGLKVEMLVMTYPEQALNGTWSVKATGKKQESLVKAMVARVLDDAAGDLEWRN
jgi:tetratricopeptide (TPR) repeat protein